ncbi:MAG: hypothetical protein ABIU63_04820 [Chitinophagaceae bacterium]
MKNLIKWKYIQFAGLTFKLPVCSGGSPVFDYSEQKIRVNNSAKNIIGCKLSGSPACMVIM